MNMALYLSLFAFTLLYIYLWRVGVKQMLTEDRLKKLRAQLRRLEGF